MLIFDVSDKRTINDSLPFYAKVQLNLQIKINFVTLRSQTPSVCSDHHTRLQDTSIQSVGNT
jgi:hypothetical protein